MAHTVTLTATPRAATGKGAARRARAARTVPGVIYGRGREPQPLVVDAMALAEALKGVDPESTVIDLTIDKAQVKTLIREIQRHPIRLDITHVDFYEIHADERITLSVPVHLVGSAEGVRNGGGVLDQVTREVEIEVLPADIPERVELDVTSLAIGHSLHVRDLVIPNAEILDDSEQTICTVVPPRTEEAAEVVEAVAEEMAEPELIRKEREEEEAEAEGEESESE